MTHLFELFLRTNKKAENEGLIRTDEVVLFNGKVLETALADAQMGDDIRTSLLLTAKNVIPVITLLGTKERLVAGDFNSLDDVERADSIDEELADAEKKAYRALVLFNTSIKKVPGAEEGVIPLLQANNKTLLRRVCYAFIGMLHHMAEKAVEKTA